MPPIVTRLARPATRNLKPLLKLLAFARPYAWRVVVALLVAAGSVLAFGQVF